MQPEADPNSATRIKEQAIKQQMLENAKEITRLRNRLRETRESVFKDSVLWAEWCQSCADMHAASSRLAFPGGYGGALQRILAGDLETIQNALCFLECRPYFFRSGYMFKHILKKMKRAPLSESQFARLQVIIDQQAAWRILRRQ